MKVLLINKFLYPRGGDAISTLSTGELLKRKGNKVIFWGMKHRSNPKYSTESYFVSYIDLNKPMKVWRKLKTALKVLYSIEAKNKVEKLIKKERPNIVHLNNFAHQISPSIIDVFHDYEIPIVMTMRDYKLVCPSYTLLSDGRRCEKCRKGKYFWCLLKKCTKGSYTKSLLNVIEMYLHHKVLHIYDKIDIFISPSMFLKKKLKEMGFKKEIICLPNFINVKDYLPNYSFNKKIICYFGRLSREKGLFTLVESVKETDIKLKIIGDGPIKKDLEKKVRKENLQNVSFLGYKLGDELKKEVRDSMAVVLPSEWYENYPRSVMEAFALGKPVIGARIGGIPELVKDNETGLTFESGNSDDLRSKIESLLKTPDRIVEAGKNARRFAEENFNSEKHYQELMKIYQLAMRKHTYK